MSRSGYSEDLDNWDHIRWRGAVKSAIRGKRGQAMLRELLAALDAMPEKELITDDLVDADGCYCTLGALGAARGMDLASIDAEDPDSVAEAFGIPRALAAEIEYENDYTPCYRIVGGGWVRETPAQRWVRMRAWVVKHIRDPETAAVATVTDKSGKP